MFRFFSFIFSLLFSRGLSGRSPSARRKREDNVYCLLRIRSIFYTNARVLTSCTQERFATITAITSNIGVHCPSTNSSSSGECSVELQPSLLACSGSPQPPLPLPPPPSPPPPSPARPGNKGARSSLRQVKASSRRLIEVGKATGTATKTTGNAEINGGGDGGRRRREHKGAYV